MKIEFTPWKRFSTFHDKAAVRRFIRTAGDVVLDRLKKGLRNPPKTGKKYFGKSKRVVQASTGLRAAAEYPARDTGDLLRSADKTVSATQFEVGTGMYYSRFLREGTKKMVRRKMSDTALTESLPELREKLGRFAYWKR